MKCRLGDLARVSSSKRIYAKEYTTIGIPFYRGKEIIELGSGHLVSNKLFISKDRFNQIRSKYDDVPEKDDVLITAVGTIGETYLVKSRDLPFYFKDGNLIKLSKWNRQIVLPEYMYYWLNSYTGKMAIKKITIGSTQQAITIRELSDIELDLPPIREQGKIAQRLSTLDFSIDNNKHINANLLNLANTLFKYYFPDINTGTDKIGDYIKNFDKLRKPLSKKQRSEIPGKYRYIGATSVNDHIDKYNFDGIYLLLGEDGTVQDEYGFPILQYTFGKFWPNNHAHVLQGKNVSTEWLYLYFSQRNISGIVTGAVQKKVSQKNMNSLKFKLPDSQELKKFDKIIQPLFSKIRSTKLENYQLEELKRVLLTKLF